MSGNDASPKPARGAGGLGVRLRSSGEAGKRNDPLAGVLWITLAMAAFACLGALGRYSALAGIDPLEITFFRNIFVVVWLLPLFYWRGWSLIRTRQLRLYGLRVAVSFISMTALFQAYARLPIGEVTAISFLAPLFGVVFAILILGERVRVRRWLALAAGFIGALIILNPGAVHLGSGQIWALASAMLMGLVGPLVKQLSGEDDAERIVVLTNLMLVPLSLVPALFVWRWPAPELWLPIAGLGLVAAIAHLALVRGYLVMDASLAMTFKFSRLPFSVLLGYLAFGETIGARTWAGAAIIVAAAAYVTHREALARREQDANADTRQAERWTA